MPNDFCWEGKTGFLLTGANQGGKTTFLRCIGLSLLLAGSGLPVPAVSFTVPKVYCVRTLFAGAEESGLTAGRLVEDIRSFGAFLEEAGPNDLLLLNEPFSGTRRNEALFYLREAVKRLESRGLSWGLVTHFYELYESLSPDRVLFLRALVDTKDSRRRLYKIVADKPEHLAYAAEAEKCGITPKQMARIFKGEDPCCM